MNKSQINQKQWREKQIGIDVRALNLANKRHEGKVLTYITLPVLHGIVTGLVLMRDGRPGIKARFEAKPGLAPCHVLYRLSRCRVSVFRHPYLVSALALSSKSKSQVHLHFSVTRSIAVPSSASS